MARSAALFGPASAYPGIVLASSGVAGSVDQMVRLGVVGADTFGVAGGVDDPIAVVGLANSGLSRSSEGSSTGGAGVDSASAALCCGLLEL